MNSLDWFSGESEDLVTSFRAGERLDLRAARIHPGARAGEVTVVSPRGHRLRVPVEQGRVAFSGGEVGVYKLKSSAGDKELRVAANLAHAGESNTRPRAKLTVGGRQLKQPEDFGGGMRSQIWPYLLLAAAALLLLEWLSYNRRVTV